MAKIKPSLNLDLEFYDANDTVLKSFKVTYKEPTPKESKTLRNESAKILGVFNSQQTEDIKINTLKQKIDSLEELGKDEDVVKFTTKLLSALDAKAKLEVKLDELGGFDAMDKISKDTFMVHIGGKEIDAVIAYIEDNSDFSIVLESLKEDAQGQMGK